MFALYPASAHHHHTPSSYQRYQAAVAEAEAARVAYLCELSSFGNEPAFRQSHYRPARRCAPRAYDYESLYLEEHRRRQQHQLYLRRLQQEREEQRRQEQLESLLGLVAHVTSARPSNEHCRPLQRQPHVYRRQPLQSESVGLPVVHRREAPEGAEDWEQFLNLFFGAQPNSRAETVKKAPSPDLEDYLKHVFGAPRPSAQPEAIPRATAPAPPQPQPRPAAASTKRAPSPSAPVNGFEELLNQIFGAYTEHVKTEAASRPAQSSSSKVPVKEAPKPKAVPTSQPSLEATLESRLRTEYEAEVRDTIQAVLESLQAQPSPAPTTPAPAPTATPSKPPAGVKGKAKAVPVEVAQAPKEPTSLDVICAMETVTNIEAAFQTLSNDFDSKSLSGLQFTAPPAYLRSRGDDSDASTDSTARLAYNSHNAPVKHYIHSLNGILAQLDAVESFGNDEVRKARKEAVARVEAALEEVEHEVDMRFLTFESKRKSAEVVQVPIVDAKSEEVPIPVEASPVAESKEEPAPAEVSVAESVAVVVPIVEASVAVGATVAAETEPKDEPTPSVEASTPEVPATSNAVAEPVMDLSEPEATDLLPESVSESVPEPDKPTFEERSEPEQVPQQLAIPVESPLPSPAEPEEPSLPLGAPEPSEPETPSTIPESIPATPLSDNEEALLSPTDTFTSIPDEVEAASEPTESATVTNVPESDDLSATIRPAKEAEPEPFLSIAFPDPPAPSKPKSSDDDDVVLVDDAHSDWSEVDA